ncbi:MAG: hypothetical protein IKC80_09895 [Kiritimatiellae bacterium]|nr:hypothetical protein [Kiritimatiellia bacterium]
MVRESRIAAFVGGELHLLQAGTNSREVVLALPLSRLIVKMVKVPHDADPSGFCAPLLQEINPFPDEPLSVGCEVVRETENGSVVIAAALPEGSADDIGEALDKARLNVVRIDALAFGELRGIWDSLSASSGRKMVVTGSEDGVSLIVLDGDQPVSVRAVANGCGLKREVMLSLLEAEDFGGAKELEEIVVSGDVDFDSPLAPVRRIPGVGIERALEGIKERSQEPMTLDVLPASWREFLEETRFKSKMVRYLAVAGTLWALVMGVLFGVPVAYGFMTDYQKELSRRHRKQYSQVSAMREKVKLVKKYSDHDRGALEMMKALSDRLPQGIELNSWNFERAGGEDGDGGLRISGEADSADLIYDFKDAMSELKAGEDVVFATVNLHGPTAGRGGRQRFDLECRYLAEGAQ